MNSKIVIIAIGLFLFNSCGYKMASEKKVVDMRPIHLTNINQDLLLSLINDARSKPRKCGTEYQEAVSPLVWNELLERLAYNHSKDMSENSFFSHTGSDGRTLGDRINATNYTWGMGAENVGLGYSDEKSLIEGWLKSEEHCRNIMNVIFTQVGVAKVGEYWTQVLVD